MKGRHCFQRSEYAKRAVEFSAGRLRVEVTADLSPGESSKNG
jgi:hypothetical protein